MGLQMYKRGQGKNTRLWSALIAATIVGIGCLQLYKKLDGTDLDEWVVYFVPAGLFALLSYVVFWLSNKPSLADFMISAEGELKKVSWSSKQEIIASTVIVIAVVIIMAGLLGATDLLFRALFTQLLGS
jgi:preprotein translocase subunit SecE